MGRHRHLEQADWFSPERQLSAPRRRHRRGTVALTTVVVLAISVGIAVALRTQAAAPVCTSTLRVALAVAPEIRAPVKAAVRKWLSSGPTVGEQCVGVVVYAADPAGVAATVAERSGLVLDGVGGSGNRPELPDIWIPDSSIWLARLGLAGFGQLPDQLPSLAQSPVVIATAQGTPDGRPPATWSSVVDGLTGSSTTRVGVVDPLRDSSGLIGLLALRAAVAATGGGDRRAALTAMALALGEARFPTGQDLLARVARPDLVGGPAGPPDLALLPEWAVLQHNTRRPPTPLALLEGRPLAATLDYPFVVMPYGSTVLHTAASRLLKALSDPGFTALLTGVHLRPPEGVLRTSRIPLTGPDDSLLPRVVRDWISLNAPTRMLVVVDASGSMGTPVPTAGGATRAVVTVESARRGIAMCQDDDAVGLWAFATRLDGDRDHLELVPVGSLRENRVPLDSALAALQPVPGGATGLYDTILAGYAKLQAEWDPTRVNTLVVMTDGRNEDPDGPTLDEAAERLRRMSSRARPVQIVILGIGLEVSEEELWRFAGPTGGGVFVASDPSRIGEIFLKIMTLRTVS